MGRKAKVITEGVSEERLTEADYYARKCEIPLDEALRIIESAYSAKSSDKRKSKLGKRQKR
jgi:hypothetical protein